MRLRHLSIALAALAVVVTTGCAAPEDDTATGGGEPTKSVSEAQKDEKAADLLPADIKKAGVVRVASGVSFPPMEYFDENNKIVGFDADLGKALGEVLGVDFKFQNTNFDGIIGGLKAGRYDLSLTSMIDKKERQTEVDFVDYLSSGVTFLTLKGNPKDLTKQSDLCGVAVAVEKGATGDLVADDITKQCEKDGEEAVDKKPFADQASAIQALQAHRADAVLALDLTLAYNVKQNPEAFEVPAEPFGVLPVGIPVPKGDTELRDAVQAALVEVQKSGVYDDILTKWNLTDQALEGAPVNQGK
jgi:polar amino acid transport system substrate-binding protein